MPQSEETFLRKLLVPVLGGLIVVAISSAFAYIVNGKESTSQNAGGAGETIHSSAAPTQQIQTAPDAPASPSPTIPVQQSPTSAQTSSRPPQLYQVALSTLYGNAGSFVTVGGHPFHFVSAADNGYNGGLVNNSTCQSITLSAAVRDEAARSTSGGSLTVAAEDGAGGGTLQVSTRTIATQTFPLSSGTFEFVVAISGDAGIYWNATLSCLTPSGH